MARQPQLQDGTSSRMQSAPINIAYGNQNDQRIWRDHHYPRWSFQNQNPMNETDDEDVEQNHHSEVDEDQLMMMHDGFSGGMVDSSDEVENADDCVSAAEDDVVEQIEHHTNNAITQEQQKAAEMTDDLFEQLLAENERKLRHLISYVENRHLILK